MTRCNGAGCLARRDCARWVQYEYWIATDRFEPEAAYQCSGFVSTTPQAVPEWVKRVPEMRRA